MIKRQTPVRSSGELRALNAEFPDRYPFLLQSTALGNQLGRFDILFVQPDEVLTMPRIGHLVGKYAKGHSRFLDALSAWWQTEHHEHRDEDLPFLGGWFVYLGYELAAEIEPSLELQVDPLLPIAFAARCKHALILDHQNSQCHFISEDGSQEIFDSVQADITALPPRLRSQNVTANRVDEDPSSQFVAAVKTAKQHISDGDVYQANLSREWRIDLSDGTRETGVYEALCTSNPAPFAGIAKCGESYIMSSSPERLIQVHGDLVSTRPIAGTRPRNRDADVDKDLSSELFAHPKERAEHVMLIDLERNDLGRICEPGSVNVNEMMVLESYAHVHHIVSNVQGRLRQSVLPGEAIAAVFPGGTITGCPKVRCMELINQLESKARGAYTGSFGYLNRNGDMDFNILIRTLVQRGNSLSLQAGSGIVADSKPEDELRETRAKAKGMLKAFDGLERSID